MRAFTRGAGQQIFPGSLSALFLVVVNVFSVNSEDLECLKRHFMNNEQFDGLSTTKCDIQNLGPKLNSSLCTLWDFSEPPNEEDDDCSKLQFTSLADEYVRNVQIVPYLRNYTPNFNITFKNVGWQYMQYRIQIGESNVCHKLQFHSRLNEATPLHLWFACHAFGPWALGYDAEVLLDMGQAAHDISAHAHFVLKVPSSRTRVDSSSNITINDWIILISVDISHKPNLVIYWPVVPTRFNVEKYVVQISGDELEEVSASSCTDGYCSVEYFAGYSSRNITVYVQPVHSDCHRSCYSSSPVIGLVFSLPEYFIALMFLVLMLLVLMTICCVYFFCCIAPRKPRRLLVLFDATEIQHCRVVRLLAEYLRDVGHIQCLMPDEEIPRSASQNPAMWLERTLQTADAVLVVASPSSLWNIRYCEYPMVFYQALPLMEQYRRCSFHRRRGRILVALPKYCSWESVPSALRSLPHFRLPQDLSWLLWTIYNQQCWLPPFTWMVKLYLQCCWCPGPLSAYSQHGRRLEEALLAAQAAQVLVEQAPLTPLGSRRTGWTGMDDENDNTSLPYIGYPGDLNALLSGLPVSDEVHSITKGAVVLDALPL